MSVTATVRYTSSREAAAARAMARVAAAGRIAAERRAAEARQEAASALTDATGQHYATDVWDVDFCHVCGRVTDHTGEHTAAQIAAWRERRWR